MNERIDTNLHKCELQYYLCGQYAISSIYVSGEYFLITL